MKASRGTITIEHLAQIVSDKVDLLGGSPVFELVYDAQAKLQQTWVVSAYVRRADSADYMGERVEAAGDTVLVSLTRLYQRLLELEG
jgi:hypothetical protein